MEPPHENCGHAAGASVERDDHGMRGDDAPRYGLVKPDTRDMQYAVSGWFESFESVVAALRMRDSTRYFRGAWFYAASVGCHDENIAIRLDAADLIIDPFHLPCREIEIA